MTSDLLAEILTEHGPCERHENTIQVPAQSALSLYVTLASENLIVERIASIRLETGVAVVATSRSETFFFTYDDIRAVRVLER